MTNARLSDMSGEELWEWYAAQPQDSEETLRRMRDIIYREAVMEVTAKMQARANTIFDYFSGEVS